MRAKSILGAIIAVLAITLTGCKTKENRLLDEENGTFYVNGVSAIDGKDAVIKSLTNVGFKRDGDIEECDLTPIGKSFTYYARWTANKLTDDQISTLTGGLFDNLQFANKEYLNNLVNGGECVVVLEWYKSGAIKKATINLGIGAELGETDAIEVNKRLSKIFPKSKVGNQRLGFMTYYNDNGIECYYTNDFGIEIEKKE